MTATVLRGDARALPLADASVDLIVTSPPYFALRSYTDGGEHYAGQIGAEATPQDYIAALIECTREWVRVLKPSGSIWVNLGDKYVADNRGSGGDAKRGQAKYAPAGRMGYVGEGIMPRKSLMLLPERYRIACVDDLGLIARAVVIWSKPNGLPESVTDRVRRSHEDWVHLTKQSRYFSAVDEIREEFADARPLAGMTWEQRKRRGDALRQGEQSGTFGGNGMSGNPLGKLPSSVWEIATEPLTVPEHLGVDHFAAFPTKWPLRIILGWSPSGICTACGEGRRPTSNRQSVPTQGPNLRPKECADRKDGGRPDGRPRTLVSITGEACACTEPTAPTRPAVVLDPFGGTGTTALVASVLGRRGISVDRSADYCRLAQWRTTDQAQRDRVHKRVCELRTHRVLLDASHTDRLTETRLMPDKEIMIKIRALEEQRAWSALDVFFGALPDEADAHKVYAASLVALAENCRATADLYERAKLKGAKTAHIDPLRTTAQQLDIVVKQLEQPRRAPLGQLQPVSSPPSMTSGGDRRESLDTLVSDAVAEGRGSVFPSVSTTGTEDRHPFEPGHSGRTCVTMVMRDGGGDVCGLLPGNPVHDGQAQRLSVDDATTDMLHTFRLLVTGSRTWDAAAEHVIANALAAARAAHGGALLVVHGDCPTGADAIAEAWCRANNTPTERHPADWNGPAGKGAGFARNTEMASTAHECFAFIRDASKGATHCAAEAERVGIPVTRFDYADAAHGRDDVGAYLRGETNDLPGEPPRALVAAHDMSTTIEGFWDADHPGCAPETCGGSRLDPCSTVLKTHGRRHDGEPEHTSAKEILSTVTTPPVPLLGQPGVGGAGYDPTYKPEGGVPLTFTELLEPIPPALLPGHLSHSQIGTLGDCPTKYRASRVYGTGGGAPAGDVIGLPSAHRPVIVEIPQWANIGGTAFHAAVEVIEREEIVTPGSFAGNRWDAEALWRHHFDAEIAKIEESSPVPRSRWRAANKGAEHEAWWRVNGPKMLERYLAARPDQPTLQAHTINGDFAAIEWEVDALVPTPYGPIPYEAIIDRVTWDERRGAYIIRDYKTGRMPEDSQQLGEYANALRLAGLVFKDSKIYGTFFNARKGEWTPEVDLDEAWPLDWFVYLVTSGHAQKMALTTGPTPARPSSFCGGCAVRWACPIKGSGVKR